VVGDDPVDEGLVTNLNRPGGNVTGVSFFSGPLNPKRLELLHELVPGPSAIAIMFDPNAPNAEARLRDIETGARMLGRDILVVKVGTETGINAAFTTMVNAGARALFVAASPFLASRRRLIVALAAHHALPASYDARESVEAGGLMTYSASRTDAFRRGGIYVGRILNGEKPGDMAVELPTKYELVINLATAKAMNLEIPPKLLSLADEVIE
jgi:putative ABC transport system substrate-binding protein